MPFCCILIVTNEKMGWQNFQTEHIKNENWNTGNISFVFWHYFPGQKQWRGFTEFEIYKSKMVLKIQLRELQSKIYILYIYTYIYNSIQISSEVPTVSMAAVLSQSFLIKGWLHHGNLPYSPSSEAAASTNSLGYLNLSWSVEQGGQIYSQHEAVRRSAGCSCPD